MTSKPIRVLFVDQYGTLGGAQKVLLTLIRALDKAQFTCTAALNGRGPLWEHLSQSRIKVVSLPLGHYRAGRKSLPEQVRFFLRTVLCLIWLLRLIRKSKFDVIYCNGPQIFCCATLAGKVSRLPVLWHIHSVLPAGLAHKVAAYIARWTSRILACSQASAHSLFRRDTSIPVRMQVLPNPRPMRIEIMGREKALQILRLPQLDSGRMGFGVVGRITPFKGQLEFIKAAALVTRQWKDVYFWVVGSPAPSDSGDREYFEGVIQCVRNHALDAAVFFVPWREDIAPCYALFDVLVLPSQGEEGLPLCALESLSMGKPVIAARRGGVTDVLEDDFNALLVEDASPTKLSAKMLEVLESPEKRRRLSSNASRGMDSWMTPQQFGQRVGQILLETVNP
ncbi:MAG: glycosyltransferase family 4 protein [Terriglobia bacterium]